MTKLQKDLENGFKNVHESFQKCFCKNFVGEETSEKIGRLQERKKVACFAQFSSSSGLSSSPKVAQAI